ncbi:MAG TPA: hypothetical protein DCR93_11215, partial [Cytophagales bacterium]|nr:hypothetical protein [Cytophagales bacterium]
RVVGLKTPPLFVSALYIGCRLGGCSHAIAQQVSHLGTSLGILIQVSDDLHDVLQDQVTADWHHPTKNLALLFMQLAEYPEKEKFLHRLTHLQSAADLPYLQQQLISSGAISYGCYKLVELYRQGSERAASLPRPFVDPAQALLRSYVQQVGALLTRVGIPLPEDLQ